MLRDSRGRTSRQGQGKAEPSQSSGTRNDTDSSGSNSRSRSQRRDNGVVGRRRNRVISSSSEDEETVDPGPGELDVEPKQEEDDDTAGKVDLSNCEVVLEKSKVVIKGKADIGPDDDTDSEELSDLRQAVTDKSPGSQRTPRTPTRPNFHRKDVLNEIITELESIQKGLARSSPRNISGLKSLNFRELSLRVSEEVKRSAVVEFSEVDVLKDKAIASHLKSLLKANIRSCVQRLCLGYYFFAEYRTRELRVKACQRYLHEKRTELDLECAYYCPDCALDIKSNEVHKLNCLKHNNESLNRNAFIEMAKYPEFPNREQVLLFRSHAPLELPTLVAFIKKEMKDLEHITLSPSIALEFTNVTNARRALEAINGSKTKNDQVKATLLSELPGYQSNESFLANAEKFHEEILSAIKSDKSLHEQNFLLYGDFCQQKRVNVIEKILPSIFNCKKIVSKKAANLNLVNWNFAVAIFSSKDDAKKAFVSNHYHFVENNYVNYMFLNDLMGESASKAVAAKRELTSPTVATPEAGPSSLASYSSVVQKESSLNTTNDSPNATFYGSQRNLGTKSTDSQEKIHCHFCSMLIPFSSDKEVIMPPLYTSDFMAELGDVIKNMLGFNLTSKPSMPLILHKFCLKVLQEFIKKKEFIQGLKEEQKKSDKYWSKEFTLLRSQKVRWLKSVRVSDVLEQLPLQQRRLHNDSVRRNPAALESSKKMQKEIDSLRQEKKESADKVRQWIDKASRLESQYTEVTEESKRLKTKVEELERELKQSNQDRDTYKDCKNQSTRDYEELKKTVRNQTAELERKHRIECKKLKDNSSAEVKKTLASLQEEFQSKLDTSQHEKAKLEQQLKDAQHRCTEVQSKENEAVMSEEAATNRVKELETKLSESQNGNKELNSKYEELEKKFTHLEKKYEGSVNTSTRVVADLKAEHKAHIQKIAEEAQRNAVNADSVAVALKNDYQKLQEEKEEEIGKFRDVLDALTKSNETLQSRLGIYRDKLETKIRECEKLKEKLVNRSSQDGISEVELQEELDKLNAAHKEKIDDQDEHFRARYARTHSVSIERSRKICELKAELVATKDHNNELKEIGAKTEEKLSDIKEQLSKEQQESEKRAQDLLAAREQLKTAEEAQTSLKENLEQEKATKASDDERNEILKNKCKALKEQESELLQLRENLSVVEKERDELQIQITKEQERTRVQKTETEAKNEDLTKKLKEQKSAFQDKSKLLKEKSDQVKSLQSLLSQMEKDKTSLQTEMKKFADENPKLRISNRSLCKKLSAVNAELEKMKEESTKREKSKEEMKKSMKKKDADLKQKALLEKELQELKKNLSEEKDRYGNLEKATDGTIHELNKKLSAAASERENLCEAMKTLKCAQAQELQSKINALTSQLENARAEIKQYQKNVEMAESSKQKEQDGVNVDEFSSTSSESESDNNYRRRTFSRKRPNSSRSGPCPASVKRKRNARDTSGLAEENAQGNEDETIMAPNEAPTTLSTHPIVSGTSHPVINQPITGELPSSETSHSEPQKTSVFTDDNYKDKLPRYFREQTVPSGKRVLQIPKMSERELQQRIWKEIAWIFTERYGVTNESDPLDIFRTYMDAMTADVHIPVKENLLLSLEEGRRGDFWRKNLDKYFYETFGEEPSISFRGIQLFG